MINTDLRWAPFTTFLQREIRRFLRVVGQTVVVPLINTTLYLLIFGVSLGKSVAAYNGFPYLAFLIPGIVMMGVLNNAFQNSASSITTSKAHGDIEDWKVLPLTPNQMIHAFILGALVRGLLVGSIILILGEAFYWNIEGQALPIEHPLIFLFFLVTGGAAFALIGIVVAFWARNFDQMAAIGGFVLLPLIYLGGVFYSLDHLHPTWRAISQVNPLLYFINGCRYGMLGVSDVDPWGCIAFSIATVLILFVFAKKAVRHGNYGRW